jgi:hypothetical protein
VEGESESQEEQRSGDLDDPGVSRMKHELVTSAAPSTHGGIGVVAGSVKRERPITTHVHCIGHSGEVLEVIE